MGVNRAGRLAVGTTSARDVVRQVDEHLDALNLNPAKASMRTTETGPSAQSLQGTEPTFENHFSVEELAEVWSLSKEFVRRLFLQEPDVVIFYSQRPGRRTYRTIRIPASVAERVHRRMRKI